MKPGDRVQTIDRAVAQILQETQDGQWILVRYIESAEDPSMVGTEDLCHQDEPQERRCDTAAEQKEMQTIELDCPPGLPRPSDLIDGVLDGTGLVAGPVVSKCFGNWTCEFEMPKEERERRIHPIIKPRIVALCNKGIIRYGSW